MLTSSSMMRWTKRTVGSRGSGRGGGSQKVGPQQGSRKTTRRRGLRGGGLAGSPFERPELLDDGYTEDDEGGGSTGFRGDLPLGQQQQQQSQQRAGECR